MRCPQCHCQEDKVVDSRSTKEGEGVRRRRECLNCGHRFTTYEGIIHAELKVLKNSGIREEFSREKVRRGIESATFKRPIKPDDINSMVEKIVNSLENDFEGEVPSKEIGNRIMKTLKEADEVAYIRFASVYKRFKDIDELVHEIKLLGGSK